MEPKMEQTKQYTPEEIAQLEKSRTISDAELLKERGVDRAEYVVNKRGEKENLLISEEQKFKIENTYSDEGRFTFLKDNIESENIKEGGRIIIDVFPNDIYDNGLHRVDGDFIKIDSGGITIKKSRKPMSSSEGEVVTIPNKIISGVMNGKSVGI